MAKTVLTAPYILINAVDYSTIVKSVELNITREQLDAAAGGDDTAIKKLGLRNITLRVNFFQDYADNGLDESLFDIWDAEVAVALELRPSTDAVGVTNPSYELNVVLPDYAPLSAQHGAMIMTSPTFVAAGSITRAVT